LGDLSDPLDQEVHRERSGQTVFIIFLSDYWVDHGECLVLIDLWIAFSLSSFQIEVEVLILSDCSSSGVFISERNAVDVLKFVVFIGVSQWKSGYKFIDPIPESCRFTITDLIVPS
jgi:hypothetical protein